MLFFYQTEIKAVMQIMRDADRETLVATQVAYVNAGAWAAAWALESLIQSKR